MDILVDEALAGQCVRRVLQVELKLSTKLIRSLKYRPLGIAVDGKPVTVRHILSLGECLSLAVEDSESSPALTPVELPLDILYEDDNIVVPAKPADMPTHPSHDHYGDTVANALAYRYLQMGIPFVFRPINRLDRNTSGLLLITRNRMAAGRLSSAMKEGRIQKRYLAILCRKQRDSSKPTSAAQHKASSCGKTAPPARAATSPARNTPCCRRPIPIRWSVLPP